MMKFNRPHFFSPHRIRSLLTTALFSLTLMLPIVLPIPVQAAVTMQYQELALHPQAAAQTTTLGKTIGELEIWNGKIYPGYGDWNANTGPITINPYNLSTQSFEGAQISVPTEAIERIKTINNKLYALMIDPTCSTTCPAGYALGEPWENKTPVNAAHIFDITTLDGNDLWMVGSSDSSVSGAHAFRSTDGGTTWNIVQTDTSLPTARGLERYYWIAQINGKIYLQANNVNGGAPVRIFDGNTWSTGTTESITNGSSVEIFQNKVVASPSGGSGMSIFDGEELTRAEDFYGTISDMHVDGDYLYVVRKDGSVVRTPDLETWQELSLPSPIMRSIAVKDGVIYLGGTDSKLYRSVGNLPAFKPDMPDATILPAPEFVKTFGTYGSVQLRPQGVAVDTDGNIYASDSGTKTVTKYDPSSQAMVIYGRGDGPGKLLNPRSVAVGADGSVYVVDLVAEQIKQYQNDGTYVRSFGAAGSGDGEVDYEASGKYATIATDALGNVYVADVGNYRIQKLNSNGEYVSQFGTLGSADGQFNLPNSVAVDANGSIFVSDSGNYRVQKFNSNGEFVSQFGGPGTGPGQFSYMMSITSDGQNIYVVDLLQSQVHKFNSNGEFVSLIGNKGIEDGQVQTPHGIAASSSHLYTIDQISKIQKLTLDGVYVSKTTGEAQADGQFNQPYDITIDQEGNRFVVDRTNNRIQKFDPAGNFMLRFGVNGKADGQFNSIQGITIDANGQLYVSDGGTGSGRVQKFDGSGQFLGALAIPANIGPIEVDTSGNIYVFDRNNGTQIKKYSSTGELLQAWGSSGSADNQWLNPKDFAIDSVGNFYVADTGHNRIQKFDPNGNFISTWGLAGIIAGRFQTPNGIAVDRVGNIVYVTDSANNRVQMFNSSGVFKTQWGTKGTEAGQFDYPFAIAIGADRSMSVVDQRNNRVQTFAYGTQRSLAENTILLNVPHRTNITCAQNVREKDLSTRDALYRYPQGFADFCLQTNKGASRKIRVTFVSDRSISKATPRAFDSSSQQYLAIPGAILRRTKVDGKKAIVLIYTVKDGGPMDTDHTADGTIKSTVSLGYPPAGTPLP